MTRADVRPRPGPVVGFVLLLVLSLFALPVLAAARASLDPDRITLGQTTTLTLASDEGNAAPDLSVLDKNFIVRGQSSSAQTTISNGRRSSTIQYLIEIEPREIGVLTVPAIVIGASATEALTLTVLPATPGSAARGDLIYFETEIGTKTPYVQQAVPYTVRLYFALQLAGGDVSARAPEHASLQQLGEDRQSQVNIGGRPYGVFERHYLLIPEQSGPMELPAVQFRGSAQTGNAGSFFGRTQNVSAVGEAIHLDVRPQPAGAPQPWLAVRSLGLARADLPDTARAGEPILLELTLSADGATSTQLPDLELPSVPGAQIFPEPAQRSDSIVAGQPVASLKRRFAIVPAQAGRLDLPKLRIPYWNTDTDKAAVAELAATTLNVAAPLNAPMAPIAPIAPLPAASAGAAPPLPVPTTPGLDSLQTELAAWRWAALLLAAALMGSVFWGWRRGRIAVTGTEATAHTPRLVDPAALRGALATGDLQDIADALRASAPIACLNLGALRAHLADANQIAAVQALERALWAAALPAESRGEVREQLRHAFKQGPKFRREDQTAVAAHLPPLYPAR
jgi:hypothetical protein